MASLMEAKPGTPAVIGPSGCRPLLLLLLFDEVAVPGVLGVDRQVGMEESPVLYLQLPPPPGFLLLSPRPWPQRGTRTGKALLG